MSGSEPAYGRPAPARSFEAGRGTSRLGTALAATAAALASAALAYWIGAAKDPTIGAPSLNADVPVSKRYAPVRADAAEIIRAHDQLKQVYADGGPASVARFGQACSNRLAARPQDLDFCVAFNAFSARLDAQAHVGAPDDLALVRAALPPGQDVESRLAQIRLLAREVSLKDPAGPARESRTASAAAKAPAKATPSPTGSKATAGAGTKRNADVRLRDAYQRAAAAGVNPSTLGREQRQFRRAVQNAEPDRAAVARLYERRIRTLEVQARAR